MKEELKGLLRRMLETYTPQQITGCLGDLCEEDALEHERLKSDPETVEACRAQVRVLWAAAGELLDEEDEREAAA
ncbi:MAG TPA: hypothetical protein VIP46_22070 [Pyrinomonadaceae bacterium]